MAPFKGSRVTWLLEGDFKLIGSFEKRRGERPSAFQRKRGERWSVLRKHGCSKSRQGRKNVNGNKRKLICKRRV